MKILITESQFSKIKFYLLENINVLPKTISDKLISNGIPTNKLNLIKSGFENSWVIQIATENNNILAIQYPALVDEIPSADKTKVDVIVDNKTKTMSGDSAVLTIVNEYKKRKLPVGRKS